MCVGGMRMSTIAASGRLSRTSRSRLSASAGLGDDVDAGVLEQAHDPLAGEHDVVGDDYAHGISARRVLSPTLERAAERADAVGEVQRAVRCAARRRPRP